MSPNDEIESILIASAKWVRTCLFAVGVLTITTVALLFTAGFFGWFLSATHSDAFVQYFIGK